VVDPDRGGVGLSVFVEVAAGEHTPKWLDRFSGLAFYKMQNSGNQKSDHR
jgi:hypothetical protein